MARYIVRRLLRALITLLVFQTLLFLLIQAFPWDYANLTRAPAAYQRAARQVLGLDRPLWLQYLTWLKDFFTGDLGTSFQQPGMPVLRLFLERLPRTLLLFIPGTLAGFMSGLWLGKQAAWRRGGWLEAGVTLGSVAFYTSFAPWLAFVLINIFASQLQWVPPENIINANLWAGSRLSTEDVIWSMLLSLGVFVAGTILLWRFIERFSERFSRRFSPRPTARGAVRLTGVAILAGVICGWWAVSGRARLALDILQHLALPLATLILLSFGETMLLMRATMVEVLAEDHILAARAKGLPDREIRDRHVARLALLPVLARFIIQLPLIIIGSFVLERVFFWQGMGEMMFQAVDYYDLPVVMGILSLVGVLMLLAHLVLDVLSAWLDPRLRGAYITSP